MCKYSTKVKGKLYYTNESGRGIFTYNWVTDTEVQIIGTNDAPKFTSGKQLNAWNHRHLGV